MAYLCCTSFSPPSAKFPCSKSHLGLDFLFAGFHNYKKQTGKMKMGKAGGPVSRTTTFITIVIPPFLDFWKSASVLKTFVLATECSLSTWSISPSSYFVKRIFGQLGIFVISDNFAGLLLSKTVNICSHMRVNGMLKETNSPARAFFPPEGAC